MLSNQERKNLRLTFDDDGEFWYVLTLHYCAMEFVDYGLQECESCKIETIIPEGQLGRVPGV